MTAVRDRQPCTCPHGERSLGRHAGVNMGRGIVRLSTTPGCPEHDSCRGFTKAYRASLASGPSWERNPYCPKHPKTACPAAAGSPETGGAEQ